MASLVNIFYLFQKGHLSLDKCTFKYMHTCLLFSIFDHTVVWKKAEKTLCSNSFSFLYRKFSMQENKI